MRDVAFFDGACQPRNPGGHGGWGFVIFGPDGQRMAEGSGYIPAGPNVSNNVAEYQAAIECMHRYRALGRPGPVTIHGDSKLVIQQVQYLWRIKRGLYMPLAYELRNLAKAADFAVSWQWVPREQNAVADELSTRELRSRGIAMVLGGGHG